MLPGPCSHPRFQVMPPFERHIFVCTNRREPGHARGCCSAAGSEALRDRLKSLCKQAGLGGRVRINQSGCLDQCEHGPTVVVYPEAVWYGFVQPNDLGDIVDSHLVRGRPVERLRLRSRCVNTSSCEHRPRSSSDA